MKCQYCGKEITGRKNITQKATCYSCKVIRNRESQRIRWQKKNKLLNDGKPLKEHCGHCKIHNCPI